MALSHERFPVKIHPTADATDVLFYIVVDDTLAKNQNAVYGALYHDLLPTAPAGFDSHFLVYKEPRPREPGMHVWYFAAPRENQDLYNFEFAEADLGGNKFNAVKRSYVIPRTDFSASSPSQGSYMPDEPADVFGTGSGSPSVIADYVLAGREQGSTGVKEIDSMFVSEVRTYIKRSTIRQLGVDDLNGAMLYADGDVFYRGELVFDPSTDNSVSSDDSDDPLAIEDLFADPFHEYWGLQANGTKRSGKQLSANWFMVTTEQVVGGVFTDGSVSVNTYASNVNYSWPPVLSEIDLMDWVRKDGQVEIRPRVVYAPEGYSGPCAAIVTITWSRSAFAIPKVDQMLPTGIHYSSPYYNVNTSECLHPAIVLKCDILSLYDPVYSQNTGSARSFSATNHLFWPSILVAEDDQRPFRGGYLRTRVVINKPS